MKGNIRKLSCLIQELDLSVYTAQACYFLVLSVFPALVLLLGLLRHTVLGAADLMDFLSDFLPQPLLPHAWRLISQTEAGITGTVLSISALTALWSAGKGIYGLMKGLNRIRDVRACRSWLRTRVICAVYMVGFILVLVLTLVLQVFWDTLGAYLRVRGRFLPELPGVRFLLPALAQTLLFCVMFMYLPDENRGFRESLPGAVVAGLGWMIISAGFSLYVEKWGSGSSVYTSVYSLAMGMLWLYAAVYTLFLGALLNRILEKREKNG